MAAVANNVNNREFWTNYVRTAHYDAVKAMGREPNPESLQNAQNARQIREEYRPVIINYSPWNWDWSSHVVNVAAAPSREERQAQQEEDNAAWARTVGTILTIVGTFIFFHTYKKHSAQQQTLTQTQDLRVRIAHWNNHNDPVLRDIYQLTTEQLAIDELNAARIEKYAYAAIALLAGGALLLTGGFMAISALITLGKIATIASFVIAAGTLGWHWDDDATLTRHYTRIVGVSGIVGLADKILQNLPKVFDENMHRFDQPNANPPQYESLYPALYAEWNYPAPGAVSASAPPPYAQAAGS